MAERYHQWLSFHEIFQGFGRTPTVQLWQSNVASHLAVSNTEPHRCRGFHPVRLSTLLAYDAVLTVMVDGSQSELFPTLSVISLYLFLSLLIFKFLQSL